MTYMTYSSIYLYAVVDSCVFINLYYLTSIHSYISAIYLYYSYYHSLIQSYMYIISGGMAYEAMNNAAYINTRVVVILNDNGQVSLPTG